MRPSSLLLWVCVLVGLTASLGCGLVLDTSPPDPTGGGGACRVDADCEDGNPCDGIQGCGSSGACVQVAPPLSCADDFACTVDTCDPAMRACLHAFDDAVCDAGRICAPTLDPNVGESGCVVPKPCSLDADCDDENPCNGVETCGSQGCRPGEAMVCPGFGCLLGLCDPDDGSCDLVPDPAACDDGASCTKDVCGSGGTCERAHEHSMCNDTFGCTVDLCVGAASDDPSGCFHEPDDSACGGGEATCVRSVCAPSASHPDESSGCAPQAIPGACSGSQRCDYEQDVCVPFPSIVLSCDACDDGNPCNGQEICVLGQLGLLCSRGPTCPQSNDACRQTVCDVSSGEYACGTRLAPLPMCYPQATATGP